MQIKHDTIRVLPDGRISREDAAVFIGVSVGTLANWKGKGEGPKPLRVAGRSWYYLKDVEAFVATELARELSL